MDIGWIREGLKKPGKRKSGLAQAIGRAPSAVSELLKGNRQLKIAEIKKIAAYLEVSPPHHLIGVEPATSGSPYVTSKVRSVMVVGRVQAGHWVDVSADDFDHYVYDVPVLVDPRWKQDDVFMLEIHGNSINRTARSGSLALCVQAWAWPREPKDGDWVVVRRKQGQLVETTVKRLRGTAGAWQLWPDSEDERFQTPIDMPAAPPATDEDGVVIQGYVLNFVTTGTIP